MSVSTSADKVLQDAGWELRGELDGIGEDLARRLTDLVTAEKAARTKDCKVRSRVVLVSERGVCLDVARGRVQAGVWLGPGGRDELYLTRHDSEPGVRVHFRHDQGLAVAMLTDPSAALVTERPEYAEAPVDEVPDEQDAA